MNRNLVFLWGNISPFPPQIRILFQTFPQFATGEQYQPSGKTLDNSRLLLHKAWQISYIAWVTLFTALNSQLGKDFYKPADNNNNKKQSQLQR